MDYFDPKRKQKLREIFEFTYKMAVIIKIVVLFF